MFASFKVTRWIFISIGIVFLINGVVVTSLYSAKIIPRGYSWQGPLFLVLGTLGLLTVVMWLGKPRLSPLLFLTLFFVPWTVIGLIGDIGQGFWPLVLGEGIGLFLFFWALVSGIKAVHKIK